MVCISVDFVSWFSMTNKNKCELPWTSSSTVCGHVLMRNGTFTISPILYGNPFKISIEHKFDKCVTKPKQNTIRNRTRPRLISVKTDNESIGIELNDILLSVKDVSRQRDRSPAKRWGEYVILHHTHRLINNHTSHRPFQTSLRPCHLPSLPPPCRFFQSPPRASQRGGPEGGPEAGP